MGGGDKVGGGAKAFAAAELEDKGPVGKGKLHDMGAAANLADGEGGAAFGIEARTAGGEDFGGGRGAFGLGFRDVYAIEGKSGEGRKKGRLRFRKGDGTGEERGFLGWWRRGFLFPAKQAGGGAREPGGRGCAAGISGRLRGGFGHGRKNFTDERAKNRNLSRNRKRC